MKRFITLTLALLMLLSVALCAVSCTKTDDRIRVGYLTGPTGMGMAKLIHDNGGKDGNEKYTFVQYTGNDATTNARAALEAGDIDIVCLPTNEAAEYYNSFKNSKVLSLNCLNSLFIVTDASNTVESLSDLSGKTIYTLNNGNPYELITHLISVNDIDATVSYTYGNSTISSGEQLTQAVKSGALSIALMPEPLASSFTSANPEYSIDLNLTECWEENYSTPIAMGCIVASKSFIDKNSDKAASFLSEYKASIEYIGNKENIETAANYIAEASIIPKAPLAKKALLNLGDAISYVDGQDMKNILKAFYNAIGVALPDDDFYYD